MTHVHARRLVGMDPWDIYLKAGRVYNKATLLERRAEICQVIGLVDDYCATTRGQRGAKRMLQERRTALLQELAGSADLTPALYRLVNPVEGPSGRPQFRPRRCVNCAITNIIRPLCDGRHVDMYSDGQGEWMCRGCHSALVKVYGEGSVS